MNQIKTLSKATVENSTKRQTGIADEFEDENEDENRENDQAVWAIEGLYSIVKNSKVFRSQGKAIVFLHSGWVKITIFFVRHQ